jgi:hypothetical protein
MKRKINKKGKIDHDRLFKELLTTFFVDFIRLFLPEVYKYLETDSIEFIDKEIFTDVTSGEKREADLIVKCHFLGRETFFLIHLEHQSKRQKILPVECFSTSQGCMKNSGCLFIQSLCSLTTNREHKKRMFML